MAYTIMLDAGHGGREPGAVYNDRKEKDDALRLTLAVGEILQNNGIDVEYTRTTDVYDTPYQKAVKANESNADFFVSIHRNSFPRPNAASGVEVLLYNKAGVKQEMAQNILSQLETVGFVDLGIKERPNLVVLKRTNMPALLIEAGFLNSDVDNRLFDENFDDIAQAIASGILDTLELEVGHPDDDGNIISDGEEETPDMEGNTVGTEGLPGFENPVATPGGTVSVMPTLPPNRPRGGYHVQVGAFRNETYANRLKDELVNQGFPAFISLKGPYDLVLVGTFASLSEASEMERRLKRAGYPTVIIEEQNPADREDA